MFKDFKTDSHLNYANIVWVKFNLYSALNKCTINFFPTNLLEAVMYGMSDDFVNHGFGTVAVGHNGEVCQQRYCTVTEHGCTRTPPHRLLPSPTPQAWEGSTIGNPCPTSPAATSRDGQCG